MAPRPKTVKDLLTEGQEALMESAISSARLDSMLLLAKVLGQPREWLSAHPEENVKPEQASLYRRFITRRCQGHSVAAITGTKEFYGLQFQVSSDVLIPRAETEKIVEFALAHTPRGGRLIDVGTGSGAIAIAIKHHRPDLEVWASEISMSAFKIAKRNLDVHRAKITLQRSDLFATIPLQFDAVVANLPYLPLDQAQNLAPEVKKEPPVALFGGSRDGLNVYRRFFHQLPPRLKYGGYVFVESDPWQHPALIKLANGCGLELLDEDYFVLGFRLKKKVTPPKRPPA